jgi:hypothetical protein
MAYPFFSTAGPKILIFQRDSILDIRRSRNTYRTPMKQAETFAVSFNAFVWENKLSDAVHLFRIFE